VYRRAVNDLSALRNLDGDEALEVDIGPEQDDVGTRVQAHAALFHRGLHRVVEGLLNKAGLAGPTPAVLAEGRGVLCLAIHA